MTAISRQSRPAAPARIRVASSQPSIKTAAAHLSALLLGEERASYQWPYRSMLDAGLPSPRIRVALDAVRDAGHDLSSLRLVTDGRHVWACHDDGQILDALRAGQLALFVSVDQVAADVDADVRAFSLERAEFVERLTARA